MKKPSYLIAIFLLVASLTSRAGLDSHTGCGMIFSIDTTHSYKIPIVNWVVPDAPAEKAGILRGDIIMTANGVSLKDKTMDECTKLIAGEEGTVVKLEMDRSGTTKVFTITRKKYEYANAYYINANASDDFCVAITRLMNDAPYDFKHSKGDKTRVDSSSSFRSFYYKSYVQVPGAISTEFVYQMMSTRCEILLATGATMETVGRQMETFAQKLTACFPDYYFDKMADENSGLPYMLVGRKFAKGYEEPALNMRFEKDGSNYKGLISIVSGDKATFTEIKTDATDDNFSNAIRKIFNDIPNKFNNVKGAEKKSWMSTSYELGVLPEGAIKGTIGGGMGYNCTCTFYEGTSADDAAKMYKSLATKVRDAMGSGYCYNTEKPLLSFSIPTTVSKVINFAKKKEKGYEPCPVLTVYMDAGDDGKYAVRMVFGDSGM